MAVVCCQCPTGLTPGGTAIRTALPPCQEVLFLPRGAQMLVRQMVLTGQLYVQCLTELQEQSSTPRRHQAVDPSAVCGAQEIFVFCVVF